MFYWNLLVLARLSICRSCRRSLAGLDAVAQRALCLHLLLCSPALQPALEQVVVSAHKNVMHSCVCMMFVFSFGQRISQAAACISVVIARECAVRVRCVHGRAADGGVSCWLVFASFRMFWSVLPAYLSRNDTYASRGVCQCAARGRGPCFSRARSCDVCSRIGARYEFVPERRSACDLT